MIHASARVGIVVRPWALLLVLPVSAGGCAKEEETEWVQFNAPDDEVFVEVGAELLDEATSTDLHSTSGSVVLGLGTATPSAGPIGTDHEIAITLEDEYETTVTRVTARLDAGDRGVDEYELEQDSADHGHWWIVLTSVGDEGEVRTDTVTFRLWEEVVVDEESTTTTPTTSTGT